MDSAIGWCATERGPEICPPNRATVGAVPPFWCGLIVAQGESASPQSGAAWAEEGLPVAAQFCDGLADVVERSVGAALVDAGEQGGVPEAG